MYCYWNKFSFLDLCVFFNHHFVTLENPLPKLKHLNVPSLFSPSHPPEEKQGGLYHYLRNEIKGIKIESFLHTYFLTKKVTWGLHFRQILIKPFFQMPIHQTVLPILSVSIYDEIHFYKQGEQEWEFHSVVCVLLWDGWGNRYCETMLFY